MLKTTVGQVMINDALPPEMRDFNRVLDKKGSQKMFQEIAEKYPDKYKEIAKKMYDLGHQASYYTGGNSFGLKHMQVSQAGRQNKIETEAAIQKIMANPKLSEKQKEEKLLIEVYSRQEPLEKAIMAESKAEDNPLYNQVISGARGNPTNLKSLRGGDGIYVDNNNDMIPIPVLRSYSQGVSPVEFFAGAFGARAGVIATKSCIFEDELVLMSDYSYKKIKDIKIGDNVIGSDCNGITSPVVVTNVFNNGLKPCYLYKFRSGRCANSYKDIICTEDHKVLAQIRLGTSKSKRQCKRFIRTPTPLEMKKAIFKSSPSKNEFTAWVSRGESLLNNKINEPRALLVGLILGDGCMAVSKRGSYTFSCADKYLLSDVKKYLASFNLKLSKGWKDHPEDYSYCLCEIKRTKRKGNVINGKRVPISGHFNETKDWLKQTLGEKLAHEKTLPSDVFNWDDESLGHLLGGIFSTDGNIQLRLEENKFNIRLKMTSKDIIEQVHKLLNLRLGIVTGAVNISDDTQRINSNAKHVMYAFSISHAEMTKKFAEKVYLVGIKREEIKIAVNFIKEKSDKTEYGCKIYSREYIGDLNTFDLEVDNVDHLFVMANGLVVSNSTSDAGYFGKQLSQATHRLVVTAIDSDDPEYLKGRGLPVPTDDNDNEGALLADKFGPYPKNTVLTPRILAHLKDLGHDKILVRSPMVSGSREGGVYARDVGVRDKGRLAPLADNVGIAAAQSASEPLSQSQLASKHSGGIAGAAKGVSGFKHINQLVQVPKQFKGGAAHSQEDGKVDDIQVAPAGGHFITVNNHRHYVAANYDLKVKKGDTVEAGDVLSEGIPNPAEIVQHKGIGEGRRYFVNAFKEAYKDAGISAHRRNVELLARGLINHVRLTDEYGDGIPEDIVPYNLLEHDYEPRLGHTVTEPSKAIGHYLERPVLHYTIGTKIRPSVVKELKDFGVKNIITHKDPPPFEPEMVRGMSNLSHDPDWMTKMLGSNLSKSLLSSTHLGAISDEKGTSYVPGLARSIDFGRQGFVRDWHEAESKFKNVGKVIP